MDLDRISQHIGLMMATRWLARTVSMVWTKVICWSDHHLANETIFFLILSKTTTTLALKRTSLISFTDRALEADRILHLSASCILYTSVFLLANIKSLPQCDSVDHSICFQHLMVHPKEGQPVLSWQSVAKDLTPNTWTLLLGIPTHYQNNFKTTS